MPARAVSKRKNVNTDSKKRKTDEEINDNEIADDNTRVTTSKRRRMNKIVMSDSDHDEEEQVKSKDKKRTPKKTFKKDDYHSSEDVEQEKKKPIRKKLKSNALKRNEDKSEDEKPKSKRSPTQRKGEKETPKKRKKKDDDFVPDESEDEDHVDFVVSEDDNVVHEGVESEEENPVKKGKFKKKSQTRSPPKKKSKKEKSSDKLENQVMERLKEIRKRREERAKEKTNTLKFDPNVLIYKPKKGNETPTERLDEEKHEEFVKVLKGHVIVEKRPMPEGEEHIEEQAEEQDDDSPEKGKKKSGKNKVTPLGQQVQKFKDQYPDTVMFVGIGYKYMLFGKDAEIASRVLGIVAFTGFHSLCACIPSYRLAVHLRRMVDAGYKCGVIRQTETAAVKAASGKKAGPFERHLEGLYTKATMVGEEIVEMDDSCGYLCCIKEILIKGNPRNVATSIVCVDVSTGEILYDDFQDDLLRRNLETCLSQIPPAELIISKTISEPTQLCLDSNLSTGVRIVKLDDLSFDWGVIRYDLESLYDTDGEEKEYVQEVKNRVFELPENVLSCVGVILNYLKQFKLEGMLRMPGVQFKKLTSRYEMSISGVTLKNLELLRNSTNGEETGSLFWLMNHTCTPFGARMLKHWICHPLSEETLINKRYDAIEEINDTSDAQPIFISSLPIFLRGLPDLEKALMRVQYGKCSPKEFLALLKSFDRLFSELPCSEEIKKLKSPLLRDLLLSVPWELKDFITKFLQSFNHDAVDNQNRASGEWQRKDLFVDKEGYPEIEEQVKELERLKEELKEHLEQVREILGKPSLNFKNCLGKTNVIEIKISEMRLAPKEWLKFSETKALARYQTPFVLQHSREVQLHEDLLESASSKAWNDLLRDFCARYELLRRTINALATLDCLFSLAELSNKLNYTRPVFETGKPKLHVINGRHPMIEVLLEREEEGVKFVPNNANLSNEGERCMIITGPNMGGKSSYIKSMALIVLMAHIGAFVPATSCHLTLFDSIYTRMGASDDMYRGQSTFFVELSEAGECLRRATERSLIVMDELGRGTSTHDGTGIAYATLEHLVCNTGALTLFVTHYPLLTTMSSNYPDMIKNYHLSYSNTSSTEVTFLYKLVPGPSPKSYGLNVARLAGLSYTIIERAAQKSTELEKETDSRMVTKCFEKVWKWIIEEEKEDSIQDIQRRVRELIPHVVKA
jgi:DNA mismatch repair protein MSH3